MFIPEECNVVESAGEVCVRSVRSGIYCIDSRSTPMVVELYLCNKTGHFCQSRRMTCDVCAVSVCQVSSP